MDKHELDRLVAYEVGYMAPDVTPYFSPSTRKEITTKWRAFSAPAPFVVESVFLDGANYGVIYGAIYPTSYDTKQSDKVMFLQV